ncbi:MAG: hypothetical protein JWM59_4367 [Verrucomicrobiales bacterium]|nr:hypothetical protein [Verrucomicrobiales bacterium]
MATGTALILSWRQLRDGTRRRMFPDFWRKTGYLLFWLPPALMVVMAVSTGLIPFYMEVKSLARMLGW